MVGYPHDQNSGDLEVTLDECLAGRKLIGDDFDDASILEWYRDEERGYYNLWGENREANFYDYHALNARYAFRFLPDAPLGKLLSFGGANGEEVRSIAARVSSIVVVDPADYGTRQIAQTPVEHRSPNPLGDLPAADGEFQLLTCFGVLHHVPNVSKVTAEFARVLAPGGLALVREPIVSMGDWRNPREGLTKRERGIPLDIFKSILAKAGFETVRQARCVHPITPRLGALFKTKAFNSDALVWIDSVLSGATFWRGRYHAERLIDRLQPASAFFVLRRR
jgi:SAM-dependent methyltransferase